jgi:hypothetical protein
MKQILRKIPTEEEIDKILDGGYEVEIWLEGGEFIIEANESS